MSDDQIEDLIIQLKTNPANADVPAATQSVLGYVMKLTKEPGAIDQSDVADLRSHGFDDLAIHDIAAITGYFAFVNRIADGLGVELEG